MENDERTVGPLPITLYVTAEIVNNELIQRKISALEGFIDEMLEELKTEERKVETLKATVEELAELLGQIPQGGNIDVEYVSSEIRKAKVTITEDVKIIEANRNVLNQKRVELEELKELLENALLV